LDIFALMSSCRALADIAAPRRCGIVNALCSTPNSCAGRDEANIATTPTTTAAAASARRQDDDDDDDFVASNGERSVSRGVIACVRRACACAVGYSSVGRFEVNELAVARDEDVERALEE
jgi:hypothetical protein